MDSVSLIECYIAEILKFCTAQKTPFSLPLRPPVVGRFVVINLEGKSEFTMSKYNWDVVVANMESRGRKPSILKTKGQRPHAMPN